MDERLALSVIDETSGDFHCPGERHPVSRSLHLARLAAGHVGCRNCERRHEVGSLPKAVAKRLQIAPPQTLTLNQDEGLRGLYVNELTRERVVDEVRRFLDIVDEERRQAADASPLSRGVLRVVIGRDSRSSSPDLSVGIVQALKQSAVDIIDAGQTSRPIFDYAVDRVRPHFGIYVTGGLRPVAWTGLDLVEGNGFPWLTAARLTELEQRRSRASTRLGRSSGRYVSVDVEDEYTAAMALQFHALRPIRIGIFCPEIGLRKTIRQLLEQTPCDVHFVTPTQSGGMERQGKTLADIVCERHLDLGAAIAIDGRGCQLIDETGHELNVDALLQLLMVPYEERSAETLNALRAARAATSHERELRLLQREHQLPVVVDSTGRCWFSEESPACDAILTLARILEVLSLTERPASYYRVKR